MQIENWYVENNLSQDSIDMIEHLKKNRPYTDKLIMDAVDKVYMIAQNMGISIDEVVSMVAASEFMELK